MTFPCLAGFDPASLSIAVTEFTLLMAAEPAFVAAVAAERDYNEAVLVEFRDCVTAGKLGEYEHASRLDKMIKEVRGSL